MYWNGGMDGWGYLLMGLSFLMFWAAVITALIFIFRCMAAKNGKSDQAREGSPERLLAECFARGEIDENEYTARLDVLRRSLGR